MEPCTQNQCYIEEHQAYFHAASPFPLDLFKNLVSNTPDALIECSCKVNKGEVHANRFNLWFPNPNGLEQINTVINFISDVEKKGNIKFNRDLLNQFYDSNFNWNHVRRFVFGLDVRENQIDSRLKIWFILNNYPEKIEKAIGLYGDNQDIKNMLISDELIVGFDFNFDGRTGIKLYPDIQRDELDSKLLYNPGAPILHPTSIELARHAYWLHIYLSDNHHGRILQLHTNTMDPFFQLIPDVDTQPFRNLYQEKKLPCAIFAFHEDDIRKRDIRNWSFYYAPQSAQQNNILL